MNFQYQRVLLIIHLSKALYQQYVTYYIFMYVFNKSYNALLQNLYTKTKKGTMEMKPGTQLQLEQKEIPLTMSHFVLAERTYIHQTHVSF